MRHHIGWAERLEARADEVLAGDLPSPDPERGMVAVSPVEVAGESDDGEPTVTVRRRAVLLWERQWRDTGDVWLVVPLTGPRSSSPLALVDHVVQFDGTRVTGLRLSPRLVRLHPSAVRRSAVVGRVSERDLDAVEDAVRIGAIRDLTGSTGGTAVSFRDVYDDVWSPDADLLALQRRAAASRAPDGTAPPPPPPEPPAPPVPPSPWQLTRLREERRRAKRRRPNHPLRHDR